MSNLHDLLANYRIDNSDNADDIRKYFKKCSFSHRKFVVGQKRANGVRRHVV